MNPPSEIEVDPYLARYAERARGMTQSEIRALFAVANRPEVISLAGGNPDTELVDFDALQDVFSQIATEHGPQALQYGGGQGIPRLREQLAAVMATEGTDAHPDDLVVTTGGQQALDLVAKLFCNPGDVVVAEGPSYVGALSAFSAYQAEVEHVPIDENGIIPAALDERLTELNRTNRRPKFVYVVPNHHNPAGVCLSEPRRVEVLEIAERHDVMVVEDNPYGLIDFKGEPHTTLRSIAPDRVIYLGTLSKIFAPGVRTGWIAAAGPVRDKLIQLKEAADLTQSNLTQFVAERWLATQPWQEQIERTRQVYLARCHAMIDEMAHEFPAAAKWSVPTGGMFVWAQMPDGVNTGELLAQALSKRVAYVPGRAFFADGSGQQFLRLNFCFASEDRLREGIRRIAKVAHAELEIVRAVYDQT